MNTAEGQNVDLHCTIKASPAARIHWLRNGNVIRDDDKYKVHIREHMKHHHNLTMLRILNVNKDDLGRYTCHAENSFGKHEVIVALTYDPEVAVLNECKLTDDLHGVKCNWTVHSAQPVSEATLFYKLNGERKWQQEPNPSTISKGEGNQWE